ncbi:unnamed protein product [Lupinus luteus]|uniref:Uncharacterized protein n=1 Tax=Lupinus luteus TaxID=3873 RepID=A0AAV1WPC7_LUPLU
MRELWRVASQGIPYSSALRSTVWKSTNYIVVNGLHGYRIGKLVRESYDPLWIKGGGHCNLGVTLIT